MLGRQAGFGTVFLIFCFTGDTTLRCPLFYLGGSRKAKNRRKLRCRGAQCAPVQLNDSARFHGRTLFAPTATVRLSVGGGARCAPPSADAPANTRTCRADIESAPTPTKIGPRRGQSVGRRKSVKKNAALLHFLAFSSNDYLFGVLRGERLAAHNERRQFAAQTRSCGYSPRWGEHCSLPSFAALNRGPLLATPQSPRPGLPRPGSSGTFLLLFWSQKRRNNGGRPLKKGVTARW